MEEDKYKNLYNKYKELLAKTSIKAYDVISDKEIKVQHISPSDIEERLRVERELKEGLEFLSDDQLIDLSGDVDFSEQAQELLTKRKEIQ